MEHEPMPTQWVLTNHRSRPLRQPVEPAAHVHGLTRQPDPRFLRTVHRLQTRQPDHDAVSTTASNARTCSASNPRPTSRLRPFDRRISTHESPAAFGAASVSCTSRNFTAVSSRSRFFHAKKYGLHSPRSWRNAVIVCPLRACSEISLRHFVHAFFLRLVMSQHCSATRSFTRWGSVNAHHFPGHGFGPNSCARQLRVFCFLGSSRTCDLNHRLAISEASVGRSLACKSCKSELRPSPPSDVWSIGWPEEQTARAFN